MDDYELHPKFERDVVYLATSSRKFYSTIGREVDPSKLTDPLATMIMESCHAIHKSSGSPPGSVSVLLQHMQALHIDGKRKLADLRAVDELLTEAEDRDPDEDAAIAALAPVIKRIRGREATEEAIRSGEGNYAAVAKSFARVEQIGEVDTDYGYRFQPDDYSMIDELGAGDRLSFGIADLDLITNGGIKRGHACMMVAPTGCGKTTMLCQILREAWTRGLTVAYATLELAVGEIDAKVRAGMTGILTNKLMTDFRARQKCSRMIREMRGLGGLMIKKFPARKTTWSHLVDWFDSLSEPEALGVEPHVLIVDMLGKLGFDRRQYSGLYEAHGAYMDEMHDFAEDRNIWLATASQPQRSKDKKRKIIDADDLNDSQGKAEGSDLLVTLNPRDDGVSIYYWVAKHRAGPSQVGVGPVPHDFIFGRMCDPDAVRSMPPEQSSLYVEMP